MVEKAYVSEVFYDIEGEGRYQGTPALFIRLSECNLRCKWCDTRYAYKKSGEMSASSLVSRIKKSPYPLVNITGGEPLMQKKVVAYIVRKSKGRIISVETNGSLPVTGLRPAVISMDLKLPSSGEHGKMLLSNLSKLTSRDQLKLVIGSIADMKYAQRVLKKHPVKALVVAQPVFRKFHPAKIGAFVLKNRLDWKVSVQLHKL